MAEKTEKTEQYFPDGSLLNTMMISIVDSEKRFSDIIKEPFIVYLIETKYIDGGPPAGEPDLSSHLWRRYSEFELLRNYLVATYPPVLVPPIPEKRINVAALRLVTDKFDPDFVEKRRTGLESFLLRCGAHHQLSQDEYFIGFLSQEDGWKEAVQATNFQTKVDSRYKSLSAALNLKEPNRSYEDMKHYADNLGTNIAAMLKVRQHLAELEFSAHKLHSGYGRVFSEWSSIEKEMGDALQKTGHYMDGFAAGIDDILEDDDAGFSDPLKEYLFFSDVLKNMSKKQQVRQYDLEKAKDALASKTAQRDELKAQQTALESGQAPPKPSGFSFKGLSSMIFGAETSDALEAKVEALDEQITESEASVQAMEDDLGAFVKESLKDYERFKRHEVRDIKAILSAHIKTQIKLCKLGVSTWSNVKETAKML